MSLVQECRSYTISIKNTCRDKNSQDVLDYVFDNLSRKFNFDIKDINKAFDEAYEVVGFQNIEDISIIYVVVYLPDGLNQITIQRKVKWYGD